MPPIHRTIEVREDETFTMDLIEQLTVEDKELIRSSWQVIHKNINDAAYHIFEMIFNQSPDTKAMFPFMKEQKGGGRSKEMEFHGLRFMQVIESMVQNLDNPVSLESLLDNLGRLHGRLAESRGFKVHHWGVFVECTLFYLRKTLIQTPQFSSTAVIDRTMINWRTVLRTIIRRMKMGLNTDLRNRQAHRENEENGMCEGGVAGTQSLTLPQMNGSKRNSASGSSSGVSSKEALSPEPASVTSTFLRPIKNFVSRRRCLPKSLSHADKLGT